MSGPDFGDILELSHRLQQDLADAQAKLVTMRSWLAAQPIAERSYDHVCPETHCKIAFLTADRLAEHLSNVHDIAQ